MGRDAPEDARPRAAETAPGGGVGPLRAAPLAPNVSLREQLYAAVRAAGRISRAELARDLGVSPGSITPVASDLIGAGLLREMEGLAPPAGRGRPPVTLGVAPEAGHVAGVKLADRDLSAVLVDLAGTPLAQATAPRDPADTSPEGAVAAIAALLDGLRAGVGAGAGRLLGVGVGLPGLVDHHARRLRWSPILAGRDVDLGGALAARLGVPAAIDNDANCVTMAELWFGRGRALPDFAVVTVEHGVGMGLVVGHAPYRGAHGLGMELGHTCVEIDGAPCRCGRRGCLEAYVSDYALVREAGAVLRDPPPEVDAALDAMHAAAVAGDAGARAAFDRAGRYLAQGLADVANLFDPRRIILSGGRMRHDLLWSDAVIARMGALALSDPPPVEVHAWDDLVWARGAAALALSEATPGLLA